MISGLPKVRIDRPRGEKPTYRNGTGRCFVMRGDRDGSYFGHGDTEDEALDRLNELMTALRQLEERGHVSWHHGEYHAARGELVALPEPAPAVEDLDDDTDTDADEDLE